MRDAGKNDAGAATRNIRVDLCGWQTVIAPRDLGTAYQCGAYRTTPPSHHDLSRVSYLVRPGASLSPNEAAGWW